LQRTRGIIIFLFAYVIKYHLLHLKNRLI